MLSSRLIFVLIVTLLVFYVTGDEDIVTNYVRCSTTKGDIVLELYRDWSPRGADRFLDLVNDGFFTGITSSLSLSRSLS
jgi:hypothetical protein